MVVERLVGGLLRRLIWAERIADSSKIPPMRRLPVPVKRGGSDVIDVEYEAVSSGSKNSGEWSGLSGFKLPVGDVEDKSDVNDDFAVPVGNENAGLNTIPVDVSDNLSNLSSVSSGDNLLSVLKSNNELLVNRLTSIDKSMQNIVGVLTYLAQYSFENINLSLRSIADALVLSSVSGLNSNVIENVGNDVVNDFSKKNLNVPGGNVDDSGACAFGFCSTGSEAFGFGSTGPEAFGFGDENIGVDTDDIFVKNNVNIDLNKLVSVLDKHLSEVAEAKKLEKEHYEFMKTPQTYELSSNGLPKLAPRDVIALSEAVKAHLNSQEAELDGSELEDFENDFDLGDVLTQLFNFKGITEDINKFKED